MTQFGYFPELITNNNCEDNKELNIDDSNNSEFTESFNKIFPVNQINEIIIDNDNDNKSESEYIIKGKEKPNIILNINKSKAITLDKSKEKTKNIEDNLSEFSSILDSINLIFCNKNYSNNSINILSDIDNKDNNIIIPQIENIKHKKESNNKCICKKRKIFYSNSARNFQIFNKRIYNKSSRQIINEFQDRLYQNELNKMNSGIKKHKKKVKNILKRKENADNIRKKIKARFLKDLRNTINKRLEIAGSNKFFKLLPQSFITNISKPKNKPILDLTFKEIFTKNFCENGKKCGPDLKNYHHNLAVLDY